MFRMPIVVGVFVCILGMASSSADAFFRRCCPPAFIPSFCIPVEPINPNGSGLTPEEREIFQTVLAEIKAFGEGNEDLVKEVEATFNSGDIQKQKDWLEGYAYPPISDAETKAFAKSVSSLTTKEEKEAEEVRWKSLSTAGKRYYMRLLQIELEQPTWLNDYSRAQRQAAAQKKPLAVIFGPSRIDQQANPVPEANKVLAREYICVYVDSTSPFGRHLAQRLNITASVGMVLSDRTGEFQAFWHQGNITDNRIVSYLQKYADPQIVVDDTETVESPRNQGRRAEATPKFASPRRILISE